MILINKVFQQFIIESIYHKNIYIAYSGGIDSSVLLYLCNKYLNKKNKIKAIHINHNYNMKSSNHARFCKIICNTYKIPIYNMYINKVYDNTNLEEKFRIIRYNIFSKIINKNATLLTGHTYDDFFENFFLKLFRGTGIDGLTTFNIKRTIKQINIISPFLNINKMDLIDYIIKYKIQTISDYSNFDNKLSRNYIRNILKYVIKKKWPNIFFIKKNNSILKKINLYINNRFYFFSQSMGINEKFISIIYLNTLAPLLQNEMLKIWIKQNNYKTPTYIHFKELNKIIKSRQINSFIKINNYIIIKYKDLLYIRSVFNNFYNKIFIYKNCNIITVFFIIKFIR